MSKILFCDIDGTLVTDEKKLTEGNRQAIERLTESGGYFVISTGRPLKTARIVADALGFDRPGCYIVCFNGGLIYDCFNGKIVYEKRMSIEAAHRVFELGRMEDLYVQTYEGDLLLASRDDANLKYYTTGTPMDAVSGADVLSRLTGDPFKCLAIDVNTPERLSRFVERHGQELSGMGIELLQSTPFYLEIEPKGVSKARGNSILAEMLGISASDTIAVGDERNDISMIREAGIGVAMCNGRDEVKAAADYITINDNNHDAVKEIIEKFM